MVTADPLVNSSISSDYYLTVLPCLDSQTDPIDIAAIRFENGGAVAFS